MNFWEVMDGAFCILCAMFLPVLAVLAFLEGWA